MGNHSEKKTKKSKKNPLRPLSITKETYTLFNHMDDQSELFNILFKLRKALTKEKKKFKCT